MRTSGHQKPQPSQTVFDLSQRLPDHVLSLAWAYLAEMWDNPELQPPMPSPLSHLTPAEWMLVEQLLLNHLDQRNHSQVH